MKYIKTFESHRNSKSVETEKPVNEEFLGALGKMIGNLFKKAKERINKTKGGKEIEAVYQKYVDMIGKELSKTAKVELNLAAAARSNENPDAVPPKPEVKESLNIKKMYKVNEADAPAADADAPAPTEVDAKTAVTQLKAKKGILDQIVKKLKDMALKEMDAILKKFGGGAANPQLEIIINSKKDQFELDYMNAQINYLEKAGDKTESAAIAKQRDVIAKKIEADFKEFDTKKPVIYKEGDDVIYLLKDKPKGEWEKLTPDEKKKPTEGKAKDIVGVHKISKIEGDKYTLLDKDEKPTIVKTGAEIVGKVESTEAAPTEYKATDVVIFKRGKDKDGKDFEDKDGQKQWDAIKEEDRNPESEAVKKMIKDGLINSNTIAKVEGEELIFNKPDGKEAYRKKKEDILAVVKPK
jgi:hypothetical protein